MNANIFVETENLTKEEWLNYRKQGIGGSDVAGILGISKWSTSITVWMDKTGQTEKPVEQNEAMSWGLILEPVIRDYFAKVTGKPVKEVKAMLQHPDHPFMLADVDGVTVDDEGNPAILEIKTASEHVRSEWSESIPVYYQTQVQHYLCVTGLEKAYVAVLVGGNSFRIYEVDADHEVQEMLVAVEQDFWNMVQNGIRPDIDGSEASKNLLDSLYSGGDEEVIDLPDGAVEWVNAYLEAVTDEDVAKTMKQTASNHLKEMLGDHNLAKCDGHSIAWKPVESERLDTKQLKESDPVIYKKYVKKSSCRRFSIR